MMTLYEEKYYKDITNIRESLNRIADALEMQNKINATMPVLKELMSRYPDDKILHTDNVTISGLASVAERYSKELINVLKERNGTE